MNSVGEPKQENKDHKHIKAHDYLSTLRIHKFKYYNEEVQNLLTENILCL